MNSIHLMTFTWTKNKKTLFTGSCENTAIAADIDSPGEGKSDLDLIWRERASQYLTGDESALNGKTYRTTELVTIKTGIIRLATIKSPLYDRRERLVGIVGCSIDITDKSIIHHSGHFDQRGFLHLDQSFSNEYLTKQEVAVLKWLLHGYTSKKIAEQINLSF
ncbi:MAG: hypothetical protein H0T84_00815, partial [Tatlockia sp.]|nr:hypothetical protein [Tatlockia sp.]